MINGEDVNALSEQQDNEKIVEINLCWRGTNNIAQHCYCRSKVKINNLSLPCNILYLYSLGMAKDDFRILVGPIRIIFSPKADSFKEADLKKANV